MTKEPFRRMRHDHSFEHHGGGTLMVDRFEVTMLPLFDSVVLVPHFRRFLKVSGPRRSGSTE